jgi:hypothetical protein
MASLIHAEFAEQMMYNRARGLRASVPVRFSTLEQKYCPFKVCFLALREEFVDAADTSGRAEVKNLSASKRLRQCRWLLV